MENENNEQDITPEDDQDINLENDESTDVTESAQEIQVKLDKAEEIANNQKILAEKAEKALKAKEVPTESEAPITPQKEMFLYPASWFHLTLECLKD